MATMPTRRVNEPTQSPVYKSVLIAMMVLLESFVAGAANAGH